LTNHTDNALMLQVKAGDLDKMGLLFERYNRPLYGFLFHMTKQKESSEDMVQVVFFKMLKYRQTFTGVGEFKTWMYSVARNVLNDHYRKNKNIPVHYDISGMEESIAGGQFAGEQIEKKQELKMLSMAMDKLSAENRELLVLCRFQELKYTEIARVLNTTEGAVKVRVHRALNQLKTTYLQLHSKEFI
jgi:RNA polymerase sigma factor (sigma-70 family)